MSTYISFAISPTLRWFLCRMAHKVEFYATTKIPLEGTSSLGIGSEFVAYLANEANGILFESSKKVWSEINRKFIAAKMNWGWMGLFPRPGEDVETRRLHRRTKAIPKMDISSVMPFESPFTHYFISVTFHQAKKSLEMKKKLAPLCVPLEL